MVALGLLHARLVNRRVGGLESRKICWPCSRAVNRRVGGLEVIIIGALGQHEHVNRRVGGLEDRFKSRIEGLHVNRRAGGLKTLLRAVPRCWVVLPCPK